MATIDQLPSGAWRARVRRKGQRALVKSFHLHADAEGWARKIESEQERGIWRDGSEAERTTLRAALDRYAREVTPRKRGAVQELSILRGLRDERIAGQALSRIAGHEVDSLCEQWRGAGYELATISRRMAVLRHVFTVAAKKWGMPGLHNPARDVTLSAGDNARARRVSDAELDALCAATGSAELSAVLRLAVETAMRRGELCRLRWEFIDLHGATAHIPHTKNGQARDVPLSSRAVAILHALPRRIDGRVFGLQPDSVTQAFERAADRAGIENLRLHDLRHEATSRLAEKLPNLIELAAVTGHKDLRMLKRYYHPRATDLAKKLG